MNKREFLKSVTLGTVLLPMSIISKLRANHKSTKGAEHYPDSHLLICSACKSPLSIGSFKGSIIHDPFDRGKATKTLPGFYLCCTYCVKTPVIQHEDCSKIMKKFIELTNRLDTGMPLMKDIKKSDQTGKNNKPVVTIGGLSHSF